MRKIILIFAMVIFTVAAVFAQVQKPVKWAYSAKKINSTEAILYIKATLSDNWHIYSQNTPDGGPVKTSFVFNKSKDFNLVGKTAEPTPITKFEDVFKLNVKYFEKSVIFTQKIKLNKGVTVVKGTVESMACNDKQCLPPEEVEFSIPVK
jgi:hypothetical protein